MSDSVQELNKLHEEFQNYILTSLYKPNLDMDSEGDYEDKFVDGAWWMFYRMRKGL